MLPLLFVLQFEINAFIILRKLSFDKLKSGLQNIQKLICEEKYKLIMWEDRVKNKLSFRVVKLGHYLLHGIYFNVIAYT